MLVISIITSIFCRTMIIFHIIKQKKQLTIKLLGIEVKFHVEVKKTFYCSGR